MNIQTEHLENHSARLTVEIEPERLEKAKKRAAKQLSKRYRIPGFRKGKAPYKIVANFIGEAAIIEEAIDSITNDVYKDALEASEVNPYGPGAVQDIKLDPPTFIFTLPLAPEINPGEYRDVRMDFEVPKVSDTEVDNAMKALQRREALVEESQQPVAIGDRVTIDIHSHFIDGEDRPGEDDDEDVEDDATPSEDVESSVTEDDAEESGVDDDATDDEATSEVDDEDDEADDSAEDDSELDEEVSDAEEDEGVWYKDDPFIHEHDAVLQLDAGETIILPDFAEALVGANLEEEVVFELDVPEEPENPDAEEVLYDGIYGRKIEFHVTIKKIENVTMPEMNDEFAARFKHDDDENPPTLLELRMRTRADLEEEARLEAQSEFADRVLDKMLEGADIAYPDEMLEERLKDMLQDFEQQLMQQGLNLETYYQVTGASEDDLYDQFEPQAMQNLERSLLLGEILNAENLRITDADMQVHIGKMLASFGENAELFRSFLQSPAQQERIISNLMFEKVMERIAVIGRGELEEVLAAEAAAIEAAENSHEDTVSSEADDTVAGDEESIDVEVPADESDVAENTEDTEVETGDDADEDIAETVSSDDEA